MITFLCRKPSFFLYLFIKQKRVTSSNNVINVMRKKILSLNQWLSESLNQWLSESVSLIMTLQKTMTHITLHNEIKRPNLLLKINQMLLRCRKCHQHKLLPWKTNMWWCVRSGCYTWDLVFIYFRLQAAPVLPGRRSVLLPGHVLSSDGFLGALHQVFREGSETVFNMINEETALE